MRLDDGRERSKVEGRCGFGSGGRNRRNTFIRRES